jgi:lipoprotein-anchoring transpeptidase ErfK/SrfK
MTSIITRRDFLKLGFLGALNTKYNPFPSPRHDDPYPSLVIGRVASDRVAAIYEEPREHSGIVRWTQQDELLNIFFTYTSPEGPGYNPVWYRVWEGYLHSSYIQLVKYQFNPLLDEINPGGQLAEVTVPYSPAYNYSRDEGWDIRYHLYFQTTHWITGIDSGPDGNTWYELTSEVDDHLIYYVPYSHLRPIPDHELTPLSPNVPYESKRIEVSLRNQSLIAYEYEKPVFSVKISSGLGGEAVPQGTRTPSGNFHVTSKTPSKHMGSIQASGAPNSYILPGVPWTMFFTLETGVAFHGTFWHNNFGIPMSHGCINMRNEDAKWLFRWVVPTFTLPVQDRRSWDSRGFGTRVFIS